MSDDVMELLRMKREGLKRLAKVFEAFDRDLQARVHVTGSMETILGELGDLPARVFKLLYTEAEWKNMCVLDDAVHKEKNEEKQEPKKTTPKRPREKVEKPKENVSKVVEQPKRNAPQVGRVSKPTKNPVNKEQNKEVRIKKKQKPVRTKAPPKKNPEMLKLSPKEEEEEQEDEDFECDITDQISTSQHLLKMKESVITVREILPKLSSKYLSNEKIVPPNPEDAQEDRADALLQDMQRLGILLTEDVGQHECTVEKVGKLYSWWRVCRRAFAYECLLTRFKRGYKKTKKERFMELRDRLVRKGISCCGYGNAMKYVRLSKFLRTFPLFIYQTEMTTSRDWAVFLGNGGPAKDTSFEKDFWSQKSL